MMGGFFCAVSMVETSCGRLTWTGTGLETRLGGTRALRFCKIGLYFSLSVVYVAAPHGFSNVMICSSIKMFEPAK